MSLQVHAGEVVGLGGLVGSGRTELLRLIYGLDQLEEGEVFVEGERLRPGRATRFGGSRARAGGPQVTGAGARLEPDEERDARRPHRFSRVLLDIKERERARKELGR